MTTGAGGAAPPREVRIGLVLYGGVSLAIYIYGVCQEILRLCRASAALDAARSAGRRAESLSSSGAPGAYAQALRRLDARAVVDIIAGTSAGGINGVALAKALALDQGLEGLRRVWVDQGDLEFLLHSPGDKGAESLIDADRHEAMVKNALDGMEAAGSRRPPQPPAVPSVPLPGLAPVLDLFVTAINLYGKLLDHRDFLGSHIQTKDYRKVFHRKLRMREYRQNDFTAEHNATLAKRCRATSSFPVAIAPLVATPGELNTVPWEDGEDVTLCLADGGILDNKPFTSMLRIIFTRSAQGRVDRVVLYVEPDPEPVGTPASKPRSKPDFLTVAGLAASGIPRYESIDQDLRAVQEHNRRVERLQGSLRKAAPAEDETVANPNQFWGQLRKQHTWQVYHHLKLDDLKRQLGDTFAAGVGKEQTHLHRAFLDELDARTSTDEAQGTFLSVFDLQYQARRAYHVIETLAPLYSPLHANGLSKEVAQLGLLERDLWNVLEAARYAQWSAWELGSEAWPAEFRRGLLALHDLKAGSVADVRPAVTSHLDAVRTYLASVRRHLNGTLDGAFPEANMPTVQRGGHTVGEALDELFAPLRGGGSELSALLPASFTDIWDRYELRDIILHPVAAVSDLGERDRIEVVRISPDAAHFIDRDAKSKLAGDAVVHFGGFLKREWRQNDILWG
ncbi:MAG: patatin-like protein, partial [SAR202 cluster bacterium]|nr:patatin-like protein [SAR202 cluster bacterium]